MYIINKVWGAYICPTGKGHGGSQIKEIYIKFNRLGI